MTTYAIREHTAADDEPIVELSLRAWEPVFRSVAAELGPELNALLHGADWRDHQEREAYAPGWLTRAGTSPASCPRPSSTRAA